MNEQMSILSDLMNKVITPKECKEKLKIKQDDELIRILKESNVIKRNRRITIQDIETANYLEIKTYCENKKKRGLNLQDLVKEIEIKWEEGSISGFAYRYFIESMGMEISKEFIIRARSVGRYNK